MLHPVHTSGRERNLYASRLVTRMVAAVCRASVAITALILCGLVLPNPRVQADGIIVDAFPGQAWSYKTPAQVGLDAAKLNAFQGFLGGRGAVVRYGYMAYTWGDQSQKADLASADKPIYSTFLFMAVEQGRLGSLNQRIN